MPDVTVPANEDFVRQLQALVEARQPGVVATVISVSGSTSARPGAKTILNAQGQRLFGWVGGGCAESTVRR